MVMQSRTQRLLGYSGDARLNDGTVIRVERAGSGLLVHIESRVSNEASAGRYFSVMFSDVTAIESVHPEGMLFCGLACWETGDQARRFEFSNCFQPGDDWDPHLAECHLAITALSYSVSRLCSNEKE